ncbi:MAG: pitrilysin family protein [Patescibacteria group bacterium]|jgi:predicted Zn-dependent peptidase
MKPKPHKLKNGMTAILVPQKGAASMTIFVMTKVGSRYETREINGASHFIEHLMFKGTKKRPTTEILTRTLDQYGAEFNAFTGKDLTAYYIKMDASKTALAIDMLHDMLFQSKYEQKEIDRERGVIIEEINMYEDNPRMHLDDLLEEALFPDSTLGWNIAGPREVIRNITRDQLIAYRDAYYIPERMTVVVAGKIQPGVMKLLQKTFGSVKAPKKRVDSPFAPFRPPTKLVKAVKIQNKETEQVQLALAFHGLDIKSTDMPAVTLLATILGGSMSSRLFIQIRERLGLCYSIRAGHDPLEDTGVFSISAGLDKKRVHEAIKAIVKELKAVTRTLVKPEELRRAKDHLRGRTMLAFEDSSTQADWYGRQWTFLGSLNTPEEKMKRLENVTAAQIRKVAQKIFHPEKMAAAAIGPFKKPTEFSSMLKWS